MSTASDRELANARRKLHLLEESYEESLCDSEEGDHVRDLELRTLRRLINELREDIVRCQARGHGRLARRILNDTELENTRRKLADLERGAARNDWDANDDSEVRAMSNESLARLINQMKEEIIWTEVHRNATQTADRS